MDVLILAAGLGSRLSNYTFDIIPKFLINIDNHTGIYYILNYWNKYANNIFLVIHSKYYIITDYYIKNILPEIYEKVKIIKYDTSDGTAYTINYLINNELKNYNINNLLLTWCDIYPKDDIKFNLLNKKTKKTKNNIYIFTNGNKCRYNLTDNNTIKETPNGNIIGIYYFQNFENFELDEKESYQKDIVQFLDKIGQINNYSLENIIDYGDEEKLLEIINKKIEKLNHRYFNQLEIINNEYILKKGITEKGEEIIKYEKDWYKFIIDKNNKNNIDFIPNIKSFYEYGYLMEFKQCHIPLYKFLNNYEYTITQTNIIDKTKKNNEFNIVKITILKNVLEKLNKIHNIEIKTENKIVFFNDLKKEIYDKVISRKKIIDTLLDYFGRFEYVNDIKIMEMNNILEKCRNIIMQYYLALDKYEYNVIIGDCNFSNILINPDNIDDIIFIDPRGYFGESKIYGIKEYDYGKILYGISGYDMFNAEYFKIKNIDLDNKKIDFEINPILFDKNIIDKYFNRVHKAFMIINWLSLAEYNKNNIWKCLGSYYYGLYLGTLL